MKDATLTRLFLRFRNRHDGKALAAVFDASARELLGVATHLVDDLDEAEDLVQTTFQIAIQKARHFDAQQSLKAWLYGILWREAAKVRRRAARRPRVDGLPEVRSSDPADEVLANEFPTVLRAALDRIPEHYREVVEPAVCEGKPPREIARDLDRAPGTVRVQLQRGLEHLRRALPEAYTSAGVVLALSTRSWESMRATVLESAGVPAASVPAASSVFMAAQATKVTLTSVPVVLAGVLIAALGLGWWTTQEFQSSHSDRALELIEPPLAASGEAQPEQIPTRTDAPANRRRESVRGQVADASNVDTGNLVVTTVHGASGTALPGVEVYVRSYRWYDYQEEHEQALEREDDFEDLVSLSDEWGRSTFRIPVGFPIIVGTVDHWEEPETEMSALAHGEQREVTIELRVGLDIHLIGQVVDAAAGTPIPYASVRFQRHNTTWVETGWDLSDEQESVFEALGEVSADSEGEFDDRFDVSRPPWQQPIGIVDAPGFGPTFFQPEVNPEDPHRALMIELKRESRLHGTLGLGGGTPGGSYSIRVAAKMVVVGTEEHPDGPSTVVPSWPARVENDGSWVLDGLPPECALMVEVLGPGNEVLRRRTDIVLDPGEDRELVGLLPVGASVHGRATLAASGQPLKGLLIWMLPESDDYQRGFMNRHWRPTAIATTDSEGNFAIENVTPGRWLLGPAPEFSPSDRSVAPLAEIVEVVDGESDIRVMIEGHQLYIRGTVRGPSGKLAERFGIVGWSPELFFVTTRGQSDGSFSLGPLTPGEYSLGAYHFTQADSPRVRAEAGSEGIVLELAPGASLSGVVVDAASGEPRAEVWVEAFHTLHRHWFGATTEDDGSFHMDGLWAGPCSIRATDGESTGLVSSVHISAGTALEDIVVPLEPAAALTILNEGEDESIYIEIFVGHDLITIAGIEVADQEELVLPAGDYVLRISWSGEADADTLKERDLKVQLIAGETVEVTWPIPEDD